MSGLGERLHFLHRCLRYRLRTERLPLATLAGLRLRDATVLDIGANRGIYCFWMARAIGPGGRLIAFEPQPELGAALRELAARHAWPGFELHALGLSDAPGRLTMRRTRVGDGSATLDDAAAASMAAHTPLQAPFEVPVARLDDLLDRLPRPVRFIKCDVEGHELAVVRGARALLAQDRPALQLEARADDPRTLELIDELAALGYRGVLMLDGRYHDWRAIDRVPSRRFGLVGHRDLLCVDTDAHGGLVGPALARRLSAAGLQL